MPKVSKRGQVLDVQIRGINEICTGLPVVEIKKMVHGPTGILLFFAGSFYFFFESEVVNKSGLL